MCLAAIGLANAQTLNVVLDVDPPNLDPAYSTAFVDRQVQHNLFDKLLEVDESMTVVPNLVTRWDVSDDGLTYTMHLQSGVRFHDGTVLDAQAVKFNLDRLRDPANATNRALELNQVTAVEVVDDLTFVVRLQQPFPPFLGALTDRAGMMVSPTAFETLGRDGFGQQPVGSGPFRFESRVRGDQIVLVRNEDYWRSGQPVVDSVVFRVVPDENVAIANLLSGQVDILQTRSIADQQIPVLEGNANVTLEMVPGIGYQGIWLNTLQPPFDNADLRRALDAAVDREVIARVVYNDAAVPSWSPYSPATPYNDGSAPVRDLEAARRYLAAGGAPDGFAFTLSIGTGVTYQRLAEVLQNMWQEVGIEVEIRVQEYGQVLRDLDDGNYQAGVAGWSGRADPDQDITPMHYSAGTQNYSGYANAELDTLLDRSRTLVGDARTALIHEAVEVLRRDVPYVYLVHQAQKIAYGSNITGLSAHPDGMLRLATVDKQ